MSAFSEVYEKLNESMNEDPISFEELPKQVLADLKTMNWDFKNAVDYVARVGKGSVSHEMYAVYQKQGFLFFETLKKTKHVFSVGVANIPGIKETVLRVVFLIK